MGSGMKTGVAVAINISFLPDFSKGPVEQPRGLGFINNPRLCRFLKSADELFDLIRDSAGTSQTSDDFAFVIRDREFI
jgi:hypothetical protein